MANDLEEYNVDGRVILPWIWRTYLRKYWMYILAAFGLMSLEGVSYGALSYMIQPMFESVLSEDKTLSLLHVSVAIFGIFVIRAFAGLGHKILMTHVGLQVVYRLQADLLSHVVTLDTSWFKRYAPGNLLARIQGDTNAVSTIWSTVLAAGGRDLIALISLFAVAVSIDWRWTLIALIGAPLLMFPILVLQRQVRHKSRAVRAFDATVTTRLDEILHGITPIKLNRLETREVSRFGQVRRRLNKSFLGAESFGAGIPALIDILAGLGLFGVVYWGGREVAMGDKTTGEFMSFIFAMALVFDPLRRLGKVSGAWQRALASLERVYVVFETRPKITSPAQPTALPMPVTQADVELNAVKLAYEDTPVLNHLSFSAPAGKVTALVGASGAGKSTVFNLLTRLIDPQSGTISLGGVPLSEMELPELRNLISVVSQDALLFDETIRDNILLGRTDISDERLQEALDAAHVSDFLPSLPDGLESPAGTRGSNLSGGQRQRVAIARALVRNAPILLLDEATSALDSKSEKVVQLALEKLSVGRTTLVIAHRLATVRDADNIIVMDKGAMVEQGTHDELLAHDGLYAGLYKLQFEAEEKGND